MNQATPERSYVLAPGLEIVPLGDTRFLLRSDFVALEMTGDAAAEFVERALQHMREPRTLDEINAYVPGYRPESVLEQLDGLCDTGVLVRVAGDGPRANEPNPTFRYLLDEIGLDASATADRLASTTVAIFGLEAHGAHVAKTLADAGVGRLLLVDPFEFGRAHLYLTPVGSPEAVGSSRQDVLVQHIRRQGLSVERPADDGRIDADVVAAAVAASDLSIVCWDIGFSAACHWANEAALTSGRPVLFSELRATSCRAGPFVFPARSACWMCYRMRSLACEADFELAMSFEEHLDEKRQPGLAERPVLAGLPLYLASVLGLETLRYLIHLNQPRLVDHVLEYDALVSDTTMHSVLVEPQCSACSASTPRNHPRRAELRDEDSSPVAADRLVSQVVSSRTGIVSELSAASRDVTEPHKPMVWRAKLANSHFETEPDDSHRYCSGKGFLNETAVLSCLGEAIERYSGGRWTESELRIARRAELPERSLDPRELVLYLPEQYLDLPYSAYDDDTELAWMLSRSLVDDSDVWLPAIGVLMEYTVRSEQEFLFPITSNGLAAGPTLRDAVVSAIYEVLERDAFLITWMNQLPARTFDATIHPDRDVRELALTYQRRGVRLALFELPTDHPVSVFMAVAFQEAGADGPAATVGLGAHVDRVFAARHAVLEVGQVRPAFRERVRGRDRSRVAELAADPTRVATMDDHSLLFADSSMLSAFDFLPGSTGSWTEARSVHDPCAFDSLIDHFASVGQDVLYANLTPPDMEQLGVHTARAVLPGFQPMSFGWREQRLAGHRLYELPQRLGLRASASSPTTLNPLPHPLA